MKRVRKQYCFKKYYGKCLLCEECRYEVLEVHRVVAGCDGGVYDYRNVVVLCSNHHSLVTAGTILIPQLRLSSSGGLYALVVVDGKESWMPLNEKEKKFF